MTARVYVVRHAEAGDRELWTGADRLRPLTPRGERQARALARALRAAGIGRLISSPFVRCVDTLRPLSEKSCIPIEPDAVLAEGATGGPVRALLARLRVDAALCTHGDVIGDLLEAAARDGAALPAKQRLAKGSIWILDLGPGGRIIRARYRPPPDVQP